VNQVLIDERRGRPIANKMNLRYTGLLGILVEAKIKGWISEVRLLLDALTVKLCGGRQARTLTDNLCTVLTNAVLGIWHRNTLLLQSIPYQSEN
jgi:predicted nucleic acid-binding protein